MPSVAVYQVGRGSEPMIEVGSINAGRGLEHDFFPVSNAFEDVAMYRRCVMTA